VIFIIFLFFCLFYIELGDLFLVVIGIGMVVLGVLFVLIGMIGYSSSSCNRHHWHRCLGL